MARLLTIFALLTASACYTGAAREAPENLPLGLPSDQTVPLKLDGYRLVSLDRTKEMTFVFDEKNLKLKVDVPLFIYLPERDHAAEMKTGLRAIHAGLSRLASQKRNIEPEEIMTLFLAMDRVLSAGELPVQSPPPVATVSDEKSARPVSSSEPAEAAAADDAVNTLEKAIRPNG